MKRMRNIATTLVILAALALSFPALPALAQHDGADMHFKYMDMNKDGVLDKEEFKMHGKDADKLFDETDADKDGKVTPEEWNAHEQKK